MISDQDVARYQRDGYIVVPGVLSAAEVAELQRVTEEFVQASRKATFRFLRDRRAEARQDFGGYRIYRVTNTPDTSSIPLADALAKDRPWPKSSKRSRSC